MIQRLLLALALFISTHSFVQSQTIGSIDTLFVVSDSTRLFTLTDFYELIVENHPTVKQANLLTESARQEIRLARGSFDPKIEAEFNKKQFNGQEYYDIFNGALKFPTFFPIDPSIGIEKNSGPYLNPERYISDEYNNQQLYAGISLPLGRGLITDERRTTLRQAELFKDMAEAEQVKIINKLLLDAAKHYWDWCYTYYNYSLLNRSVVIAREIFERTKVNYTFGEASVVDTVQARITWQQRVIEQQEAFLSFKNSGLSLSTMLWDSLGNPLDLDLTWMPVLTMDAWAFASADLKALIDQARSNHPELKKIEVKIDQLETEKRLAVENLKPRLNLNYYAINQPLGPDGEFSYAFNDNYKFGLDFSFPIFLRKERAKLAIARLKISNTQWERTLTERQIINHLEATYNRLTNLRSILASQAQMVVGYERLLEAELMNLEQGESDLFKLNLQLEKLIEAQSKWIKLLAENEKHKAELYWAAGTTLLAID
jgi:outer membrane protein TolC